MQRTFKSKIGWWYYLILIYCSGCLLLAIWYKEEMGMAALFLADLALIQFMLKTEYVITDGTLLLKCWIMPVCRIPVAEITKVEDSHNPLSSYALSLDRLKIIYGKRYSLVSPDNKKDFIAELQKYNSDIIYVSRKNSPMKTLDTTQFGGEIAGHKATERTATVEITADMFKKNKNFDVAILGGGPAGYTAAERAAQGGLSVVLFEKNALGGVCLNEGCIPTKTLLYSAKLYQQALNGAKYGINNGNTTFDYAKIAARKTKVVRKLVAGIKARMNEQGVTVINQEAKLEKINAAFFELSSGQERFQARNLIICTGSETTIPPIPGIEQLSYWTSREALAAKEIPASVLIIGGGVIGMEFAALYNSFGSEVTVVEALPEILGNTDNEAAAFLREEYAKRGVKFHLNSLVTAFTDQGIEIKTGEETQTLTSEKILLSSGRRPRWEGMGLEQLGLERSGKGIRVNEYMQTSFPHVYACGDVTGYSLLAHTAVREAEAAVHHLLGEHDAMSYEAVPSIVYTQPEIASVGATEAALTAEGREYQVLKRSMNYSGRFVAENEGGNGFCKLLVSPDGLLLGAHIVGSPASEFIVAAGMAIDRKIPMREWRKTIFPHPTVAEILKECISI